MGKYCPTCNKQLQYEDAEICPSCGVRIKPPPSRLSKSSDKNVLFFIILIPVIFIGFIVIAAVFSYVVLGAGFFTTTKSQEVVHVGVAQPSTNIEILGDVYGRGSGSASIVGLNFTIGLAAGGTPIDLQRITMEYSNVTGPYEITRSPHWLGMSPPPGSWTVITVHNGDTDSVLEKGEQAYIAVALPGTKYIVKNDPFTLEIQPNVGASLAIKRQGPPAIDPYQRLY